MGNAEGPRRAASAVEPAATRTRTIALVYARQDDTFADALAALGDAPDVLVVRRKIGGLPARTFQEDADPQIVDADIVLVVVTPWLQASDWAFSDEAAACVARGVVRLWVAAPTRFGGSALASAPAYAASEPDAVVRAILGGDPAPGPTPHDDVPPYAAFAGSRERSARVLAARALLAERLEGLYAIRATRRGVRGLVGTIRRTTQALREGPQLGAGEMLGDGMYRLLENLGHGAVGSVWRARDRESGQLVAVKVLHAQWIDDGATLDAFFEMARRAASIQHPSICPIVDPGGTDSGFPFHVTAYQPGGSLAGAMSRRGGLELGAALQAVLDVAGALEAAHAAGIVHGNLKPSNVLFSADGAAVLTDFSAGGPFAPVDGGDAIYAAPERLSGASSASPGAGGAAGPESDVYSLAMTTLFALRRGPLPFWVLREPERAIAELAVGDGVKAALRAALDWDPARRTPTVKAFVEGLVSDAGVVHLLGETARASGRYDVAAEHLRGLIERADGRPPVLLLALGRTLRQAGDAAGAESALVEVLGSSSDDAVVGEVIGELEELAATRGSWVELAEALRSRALGVEPVAVLLLVRAARLLESHLDDDARVCRAWEEVLEHHQDRDEAAEALTRLTERAEARGDWSAYVGFGRHRYGFLPARERPALAWRLGVAAMDHLRDAQEALLWLQRAQDGGSREPDLPRRLEAIRSARGEWRQVVSLMLERAEALDDEAASVDLLLRAARVALYAHNHHDDAAAILLRVLLRDPEHRGALRFLARHHARAGRDDRALALYARLAPHEERGREGEAVDVRVADNVDYARVLLRNDRPRGAQLCLEAALDLNPNHVPTLALASQLSFDLGKWEEARVATQGLVHAFNTAQRDTGGGADIADALCRLGDLAWLHGDLVDASSHYHAALELHPEHVGAWWGKAKVAIAGNGGRVAAARMQDEPWLVAAPVRLTPHESLARLIAALLERGSITAWLGLDPMGPEVLRALGRHAPDDGPTDLLLASAAVDVLVARHLVRSELFRRLAAAFPAWSGPIEAVRRLWFDGPGAHAFSVSDAYGWNAFPVDFDPAHHREVIHLQPPLRADAPASVRPSLAALHHGSAWKLLVARSVAPAPPAPRSAHVEPGAAPAKQRSALIVFHPERADQRVVRLDQGAQVGGGVDDEVSLPHLGLEPAHLGFERVENWFYVRASGPLEIDGVPAVARRLRGGERLRVGGVDAIFYAFDADDPPDLSTGLPVARPAFEDKPIDLSFHLDEPRSTPKAAVFYSEGGTERMIPFVGDVLVLDEGPRGEIVTSREERREFDVMIVHRDGRYFIDENDTAFFHKDGSSTAIQPLEHGDEFVLGARLLQFRMLHRAQEVDPVEDLASLWGTPAGVPILVYDDGTRHGRPIPLTADEFSIGRGRNTDFQISVDASLSRVHCRLERKDGGVWVRDAGSSNGTRVNGVQLDAEVLLADGDLIEIGQTRLHYRSGATQPSAPVSLGSLHDFGTEEPTEVLPVGELTRKALPLDEGLDKIRVANRVIGTLLGALDEADGPGRGRAELQLMLEARPRAYQSLLDGIEVRENGIPGLEVMYNLAQRADPEQRPLLNFVLGDLIDRVIEQVCELLPDERIDGVLARVAEARHRDFLRF